ncbi:hypothetical protein C8Q76DRAFT_704213 [Earliella scabrosa]|nr:hypothetical protein C8Q76DRAFT_704213 [Earliella scabrosa]
MFPPTALPLPREIVLITDEILSPGDFLLHRFLINHLKGTKKATAILVCVSEDLTRWKSVASKSNVNLSTNLDLGSLMLVDVMSHLTPRVATEGYPTLGELYKNIHSVLNIFSEDVEKNTLLILDDLTALEWIGIPTEEIARFARALCALSRRHNSSLVVRHHITTPSEPDELFKRLVELCDYHLDIFPLSSGRSGSVSGQVSLHCGPAITQPAHRLVARNSAVHYRLSDSGSVFFDRGTSNGVL